MWRPRPEVTIILETSERTDPVAALSAVTERRSTGRLTEPGPTRSELQEMLRVACTAPDHGRLQPWRFVVLEGSSRSELGAAFARAEAERDPEASDEVVVKAARKPLRAPVIVVVLGRSVSHPKVPDWEQLVAAGCAAQNLCVAATAHGYGSMWRTGWYGEHPAVRSHLGLDEQEQVVGFVYLGTVAEGYRPPPREVDLGCVTWRT